MDLNSEQQVKEQTFNVAFIALQRRRNRYEDWKLARHARAWRMVSFKRNSHL